MAKQKRISKASKQVDRYFLITKVFLAVTPLICYFYVSMQALMHKLTFQQMLVQDPNITIIFLIAMVNPYVAYLVNLIEKKLKAGNHMFATINMVLLLIAQILTMNVFYFIMLAYVFYKAVHYYHVDIRSSLKEITVKQSFFCGGGSIFVMFISSICLFATIQLL